MNWESAVNRLKLTSNVRNDDQIAGFYTSKKGFYGRKRIVLANFKNFGDETFTITRLGYIIILKVTNF